MKIISQINQRELGQDFYSHADALWSIVREDPDVILIGEMRDSDTVRAAVAAAETGHLVLTSLHTASSLETFNRILYFFSPNEKQTVRQNLRSTLIAIMNQMLIPCTERAISRGISRVPATEVLINTSVVREYICDKERTNDLEEVIAEEKEGMYDFNSSLTRLLENNYVFRDVAIGSSLKPEQLQMKIRGIR